MNEGKRELKKLKCRSVIEGTEVQLNLMASQIMMIEKKDSS